MIEVLRPGPLTTVQDRGRPGLAHLGVPVSGAADAASLALANRLVGNPPGAAALELTYGGPDLRFATAAIVALCGATADAPLPMNAPHPVAAGTRLRIGALRDGARAYLAVRGGIAVAPVLGSRATDVLTGLGPPPLRAGDVLPVGPAAGAMPGVDVAPVPVPDLEPTLRVRLGPRDDWFTDAARHALLHGAFTAGAASNRTGVRLEGVRLERATRAELPSEGLVPGAIEVPTDGTPVLLLTDHPTTGGYPVIAVLEAAELPRAGQLRAGGRVRFTSTKGGNPAPCSGQYHGEAVHPIPHPRRST